MDKALPINSQILKWARLTIRLTIRDVATRMNKTDGDIRDWESGKSSPTYPQLEKLAYEVYRRPVAVFFFPNVPDEETPNTEFRTLPDALIETLPVEIIKLYRKAKVFQLNLAELFENSKPVMPNLVDNYSLSSRANIPSLAREIRKEIGYSIGDQFSWQFVDLAFKNWRRGFEDKGIFIFKDAFRNDHFSGFCVYDERYPIIFVNNSMPDSRQIFTLFHELGHLLYHLGGIDFRDSRILETTDRKYLAIERNCNRFAAEFLVPSEILRTRDLDISEKNVAALADSFCVSREVILRKFLDFRLIDNNYYKRLVRKWAKEREKPRKEKKRGHYYYTQIAYLGSTYIDVVFGKYYQNKISLASLADYLNIKETNVSSFEHFAFR